MTAEPIGKKKEEEDREYYVFKGLVYNVMFLNEQGIELFYVFKRWMQAIPMYFIFGSLGIDFLVLFSPVTLPYEILIIAFGIPGLMGALGLLTIYAIRRRMLRLNSVEDWKKTDRRNIFYPWGDPSTRVLLHQGRLIFYLGSDFFSKKVISFPFDPSRYPELDNLLSEKLGERFSRGSG